MQKKEGWSDCTGSLMQSATFHFRIEDSVSIKSFVLRSLSVLRCSIADYPV